MSKRKYLVILIPIVSAIFVVTGWGFELTGWRFPFRAAVSVSCAVILWLMFGQEVRRTVGWVIAALLVSSVADWFMMNSGKVQVYFLYGVCLFFVAHVCFLVFCLKNGRIDRWLLLSLLTGYLAFFFLVLRPAIFNPILLAAVLAYLLISCFSLAAAAGLRLSAMMRWCFTAGIALLVFSDTIIALKDYAGYKELGFLILPTYFASHIIVTLALISD